MMFILVSLRLNEVCKLWFLLGLNSHRQGYQTLSSLYFAYLSLFTANLFFFLLFLNVVKDIKMFVSCICEGNVNNFCIEFGVNIL